jgi:hypothetical protein
MLVKGSRKKNLTRDFSSFCAHQTISFMRTPRQHLVLHFFLLLLFLLSFSLSTYSDNNNKNDVSL